MFYLRHYSYNCHFPLHPSISNLLWAVILFILPYFITYYYTLTRFCQVLSNTSLYNIDVKPRFCSKYRYFTKKLSPEQTQPAFKFARLKQRHVMRRTKASNRRYTKISEDVRRVRTNNLKLARNLQYIKRIRGSFEWLFSRYCFFFF